MDILNFLKNMKFEITNARTPLALNIIEKKMRQQVTMYSPITREIKKEYRASMKLLQKIRKKFKS